MAKCEEKPDIHFHASSEIRQNYSSRIFLSFYTQRTFLKWGEMSGRENVQRPDFGFALWASDHPSLATIMPG